MHRHGRSRRHCFVEDGEVAGDTMHAILLHRSLELTTGEEIATEVVQPDGLPTVLKLFLVSS